MIRIWKNAIRDSGMEYICMYNGLKHSSATQYLNEKGMSLTDLMAITGHKQLDTVSKYAKHDTRRIRELMVTPKLKTIKKQKRNVG
jgi:site-specific recombinase XerD